MIVNAIISDTFLSGEGASVEIKVPMGNHMGTAMVNFPALPNKIQLFTSITGASSWERLKDRVLRLDLESKEGEKEGEPTFELKRLGHILFENWVDIASLTGVEENESAGE